MQIDTAGTYTLKYTAEDECGNVTEVTREVVAEIPATYRTVLYTDGTFIINESSRDQATNEALHGVATNVYDPFDPNSSTDVGKYIFANANTRPWNARVGSITAAKVGSQIQPTDTSHWFSGCTGLISIDLANLDTSESTSMGAMFYNCRTLQVIDVSHFDTRNVVSFNQIFSECQALRAIDVSSFNTKKATAISYMFYNCKALTSVDLSNFDSDAMVSAQYAFSGCTNLETVALPKKCFNALNAGSIFNDCVSLRNINIKTFITAMKSSASNIFKNCRNLVSIDLSDINAQQTTSMANAFEGCENLEVLDLAGFSFGPLSNGSIAAMFKGCSKLQMLDLSSFNTAGANSVIDMFNGCVNLQTIYASATFDVSSIVAARLVNTFANMSSNLVGGAGTTWSASAVRGEYARIDNPPSAPGYFTLKA